MIEKWQIQTSNQRLSKFCWAMPCFFWFLIFILDLLLNILYKWRHPFYFSWMPLSTHVRIFLDSVCKLKRIRWIQFSCYVDGGICVSLKYKNSKRSNKMFKLQNAIDVIDVWRAGELRLTLFPSDSIYKASCCDVGYFTDEYFTDGITWTSSTINALLKKRSSIQLLTLL